MAFVDCIQIKVASGAGGKGAVHFQRTRRSPRAGPDGGDGGNGGNFILSPKADLKDFSHLTSYFYKAENGKPGEGGRKKGAKGADFTLYLPSGTICYDTSNKLLKELNTKWCVLKGGKGGKGNHFFKTASLQAPQISQPGEAATQKKIILQLKWYSNACFIGLRNSGKTSLMLKLAQRIEKIYPSPYPKLFSIESSKPLSPLFIVDLPGLSSSTRKFLKQAERTKLIVFVVSLWDDKPFYSYQKLKKELLSYDQKQKSKLSHKKSILLIMGKKDQEGIEKLKAFDKESVNKICFFSLDNIKQINQLRTEILKSR